jgi:hypothetical protein
MASRASGAGAARREPAQGVQAADACLLHGKSSPQVADWKTAHARRMVGCVDCHGHRHKAAGDARAAMPTDACAQIQPTRWPASGAASTPSPGRTVEAMPTFHYQALAVREGEKGSGGCHSLGLESEDEAKELARVAAASA